MVERDHRRGGPRRAAVPGDRGVDGRRRDAHGCRRGGDRPDAGNARRDGRRGWPHRRCRGGHRRARERCVRVPRHVVVDLVRERRARVRRAHAHHDLRQRRARQLRADRDDAGRGRRARVDQRSALPLPDGQSLRSLVAEAETADAASGGLFFLPYLLGERSPHWNPDAAGSFIGLGRHHTRAHLARAVLEGVAFNLYTCITAFREAGSAIDRVDAIGGGALSDAWLQIMADVWGVPVRRRSVVEEANSLGAAVTGAVGLGLVDSFDAARELSSVTGEFTPDASRHTDYARRHETFRAGYDALEAWFSRRSR
ncbi:FGGY-family carbohydrate kinase [Paramicrobacterium humi]|uniref:FGGY-family carbohydrate kinase n=1 Tax=Paramicrobacterium humi TaxID=640635 RepID=UPI001FE0CEE3|nr:FGGY-family carbohydrate kinase [Microbacterium humi]